MDLLCDAHHVVLTPDTTHEQVFTRPSLPARQFAPRGSRLSRPPLHAPVSRPGLIIRAKAGMNPQVVEAFREDGLRLRALWNSRSRLSTLTSSSVNGSNSWWNGRWRRPLASVCSSAGPPDEGIPLRGDQPFGAALSPRYDLSRLQWRWQVELLFKEWNPMRICTPLTPKIPRSLRG